MKCECGDVLIKEGGEYVCDRCDKAAREANKHVSTNVGCLKRIEVSPDRILAMLQIPDGGKRNGERVTFESDPIPNTAKALRCGITENGNVMLVIEDESFEPVEDGRVIPELRPMYRVDKIEFVSKEPSDAANNR